MYEMMVDIKHGNVTFVRLHETWWTELKQYIQLRVTEIEFSLNLQVPWITCNYVKED